MILCVIILYDIIWYHMILIDIICFYVNMSEHVCLQEAVWPYGTIFCYILIPSDALFPLCELVQSNARQAAVLQSKSWEAANQMEHHHRPSGQANRSPQSFTTIVHHNRSRVRPACGCLSRSPQSSPAGRHISATAAMSIQWTSTDQVLTLFDFNSFHICSFHFISYHALQTEM